MSAEEVANQLVVFDWELFSCVHEVRGHRDPTRCSTTSALRSDRSVSSSSSLVSPAGGVCVLRVSRRAVALAPPQPGAGTAALQRGAALGRHRDPAVSVAAEEGPAAPQVHQDRSSVSPCPDPGQGQTCRRIRPEMSQVPGVNRCLCVSGVSSSRTCCRSSLWFWVWIIRLSADYDSPGRYRTHLTLLCCTFTHIQITSR